MIYKHIIENFENDDEKTLAILRLFGFNTSHNNMIAFKYNWKDRIKEIEAFCMVMNFNYRVEPRETKNTISCSICTSSKAHKIFSELDEKSQTASKGLKKFVEQQFEKVYGEKLEGETEDIIKDDDDTIDLL